MRDIDPTAIYAEMVAYAGNNEPEIRQQIDKMKVALSKTADSLPLGCAAHSFVWLLSYEMSMQWAVVERSWRAEGIADAEVLARRVEFSSAVGMMVTSAIQHMLQLAETQAPKDLH